MWFVILLLSISSSVLANEHTIQKRWNWHDEGNLWWSEWCDWNNNDLSNVQARGEQCGGICARTWGCTHFTWTGHNGGTCWMKKGWVNLDQAKGTNGGYSVCGMIKSGPGPAPQPQPPQGGGGNAKGTMWADATDSGGCQMPQGNYRVQHALALGQSPELGNLVWRNGLCGQVLRVSCGGSSIEAVVASTCNLGSGSCGVDLIRKSWNEATGWKPPGEARCSVQLTNTNPLNDDTPVCYTRPWSGPQAYFTSLGVFNTNGRVVKSANAGGVQGKFQSGSGYFDFDGQGQPKFNGDAWVSFNFEDGSNASFQIKNCRVSSGVNIWR